MKKSFFFVLLLIFVITLNLSAETNFYGGLKGLFNNVKIKYKDSNTENKINFTSFSFGGEVEINETYYFSAYFGLTSTKFSEPIVFNNLPFSIKTPSNSNSGMYMNFNFSMFPFEIKGIELGASINADIFMLKKNEWELTFPIVKGNFNSTINSYNFNLSIMARGEISNGLYLSGGPSLMKIFGNINGIEEINDDLKGEENINFSNKSLFGLVLGINYNVEDYLLIKVSSRLINSYGIEVTLNYIF